MRFDFEAVAAELGIQKAKNRYRLGMVHHFSVVLGAQLHPQREKEGKEHGSIDFEKRN
jgi:hypothetical protein